MLAVYVQTHAVVVTTTQTSHLIEALSHDALPMIAHHWFESVLARNYTCDVHTPW